MTLFPNRERLEIPKAEGSDAKEVFAFFGLCSYNCQILEQGLVNLVVVLRLGGQSRLTGIDIDALFERERKRTLGQLITEASAYITIPKNLEKSLASALHDRNYIAHKFFVIHDIDFNSEHGRSNMIDELRQTTSRLQTIDHEIEAITHPLWERFGLTAEAVENELMKMRAEAQLLDKTS